MPISAYDLHMLVADARKGRAYPDVDDVIACLDVPDWSEAVRDQPPIIRAMSILQTFRGQYRRNGLDGFAWNYSADMPALIEAFEVIGARATAALLADILGSIAAERSTDDNANDPVASFLAVRTARGAPAFGPWLDVDPIDDVQDAILSYLDEHADEVVRIASPE